jgi:subtilisin family serine protease
MNQQQQKSETDATLRLVDLLPLMSLTGGSSSLRVAIVDGPVDLRHPAFVDVTLETVRPEQEAMCRDTATGECFHGTAVAGILFAHRSTPAPAICPSCTLLLYPIFGQHDARAVTTQDLSHAIVETVDAGANIVNLSLGVITTDFSAYRELDQACEYAARQNALVIASSGNQGRIGFLPLFHHPWILPVAACDANGRLTYESNLSPSIGTRGVRAPGADIYTTSPGGRYGRISGTSAAAAFVTGGLALLWSENPRLSASEIRRLAVQGASGVRNSIVPPLFNVQTVRELSQVSSK